MITDAEREEKERIKREKIRKFESPIPFVILFRNWIFGKQRPDMYTLLTFFANLVIWFFFLIWTGFSYFTIISREWIWEQKGIAVTSIVDKRGIALGFEPDVFIARLEFTNLIGIVCWCVFFIGLVFLYRKRKIFIYLTLIPMSIYLLLNLFYLGMTYFLHDVTMFDKVLLLIAATSLLVHSVLMKNERNGGSIGFFGEAMDVES